MGDDEEDKTLLASIDQIIEDKKAWESQKARIEDDQKKAFAEWEAEKARLEVEKRKFLEEAAMKAEEDRLMLEVNKEIELARRAEEAARLAEEKAKAAEKVAQEEEQRIRDDQPSLGNNIMGFFKRRAEEVTGSEKEQGTKYVESVEFSPIGESDESYWSDVDVSDRFDNAVIPEVLDVDVDVISVEKKAVVQNSPREGFISEVDVEVITSSKSPLESTVVETIEGDNDSGYYANVEVVTIDDDMDMTSAVVDENMREEEPENPLIVVTLRALDVIFFVAEKALTVGLPGLIDAFKMARTRTDEIQRSGLGKDGWDLLENTSSASKRY